jgi:choline dehydrogenase-like flavoprotein
MLTENAELLYDAMVAKPNMPIPKDGNAGIEPFYYYPTQLDPRTYTRSYARTGHWDGIQRPNYDLIISSKVTKVDFNGKSAIGLSFKSLATISSTITTVKAREEVILALGAIHTPQLLELSGIGPRSILSAAKIATKVDLPGVGENFQDHGFFYNVTWQYGLQSPAPNSTTPGDPKD